jgi:hypothetical protein
MSSKLCLISATHLTLSTPDRKMQTLVAVGEARDRVGSGSARTYEASVTRALSISAWSLVYARFLRSYASGSARPLSLASGSYVRRAYLLLFYVCCSTISLYVDVRKWPNKIILLLEVTSSFALSC